MGLGVRVFGAGMWDVSVEIGGIYVRCDVGF